MRPSALAAGLFSLLSTVATAADNAAGAAAAVSHDSHPTTVKPPQVFKNANLVHIISLERNYAKEQINVLVENIDKEPQDEYYVPFTSDQFSRIGGFEVKDRKDAEAGPFDVDAVGFDPSSDLHYYRIRLPTPLVSGGQQTLGISYYVLEAYTPLPASIEQDAQQFLVYGFSAYAPSVYPTAKQKTEVKCPTTNIPSYTRLPGTVDIAEFPEKQGSKLVYGPFDEKPAGASSPVQVRFEFTKPVNHVSLVERDIEVSHWGGNVAFEERYTLYHRGANLSSLFNRVKWAQSQFINPTTYALKELKFPLAAGSVSPYYTDTIGNVSTSKFRSNGRDAVLEARPRYPIFGGWKYPFTVGWNSDAANFVRAVATGGYVLKVPFLEGPRQPEGVEYGQVNVNILLPEGSENVKFYTDIPGSSLTETNVDLHKTFLDTVGRTSVTFKAVNLVDDFRDRQIYITYDYEVASALRKPLVVFGTVLFIFVTAWVIGNVDVGFSRKK